MLMNPREVILGFVKALAKQTKIILSGDEIVHDQIAAPHKPPDMPMGKCAIYIFSLCRETSAPAGANRALKVGKAGPETIARFKYQHYSVKSARSTLAGAIMNNRILWHYIAYDPSVEVGSWIKANTDRDHFFMPAQRISLLPQLEVYIRGLLGPVYEGSMKGE